MKTSNSLGKFGVPKPVTGSHPLTAANPDVPQPGLLPAVMSLKAVGLAYKVGFTNPMTFFSGLESGVVD